jgi:hypothetical protein
VQLHLEKQLTCATPHFRTAWAEESKKIQLPKPEQIDDGLEEGQNLEGSAQNPRPCSCPSLLIMLQ